MPHTFPKTSPPRGGVGPVTVLMGPGSAALAELIGPFASTSTRALTAVLTDGALAADLVIVVTDQALRDVAALTRLRPAMPPILVVARGLEADAVVPVLRSGATSVLLHGQFTRADLLDAVHATAHGHSRLSPAALTAVVRHLGHPRSPGRGSDRRPLSHRQQEIMAMIANGDSNAAIAAALALTEKTIRNQVSRIYARIRARNRAEAIVSWLGQAQLDHPVIRTGNR
jgi:DNA-binding NarL/FixJ family response regulator